MNSKRETKKNKRAKIFCFYLIHVTEWIFKPNKFNTHNKHTAQIYLQRESDIAMENFFDSVVNSKHT